MTLILADGPRPGPNPFADSHGRVPYLALNEEQRHALHDWCTLHEVDYTRVPIDPAITYDPATKEWHIEVLHLRHGCTHLSADGTDVARVVLHRTFKAELPWPMANVDGASA